MDTTTVIDMALEGNRRQPAASAGRSTSHYYRALILIAAAVVSALALQSATARLFARKTPDLALRVSPNDAIALAAKANTGLATGLKDGAQMSAARAYAERSLRRDLTRDDALLVLAATTSGPDADRRATRIVQQAANLSRRNFAAQLWLIEDAVRRESVVGALRQFDIALRTNQTAGTILFPVLRNALEEPALTVEIARTLNEAPWRGQFLQYAVSLNRPSAALAAVVARQRGLGVYQGTDLKGALVTQLVAARSFDVAARLALGGPAGLVQDPDFARDDGYPPFSWQLTNGNGLVARRLRDGSASGLQIQADEGAAGVVASQLIRARPGQYILSASMLGGTSGLSARLECAIDKRELARMSIGQRIATAINVPTGCPYQTLNIAVAVSDQGSGNWQLTRLDLIPQKL